MLCLEMVYLIVVSDIVSFVVNFDALKQYFGTVSCRT